jgi:hypothetical protein
MDWPKDERVIWRIPSCFFDQTWMPSNQLAHSLVRIVSTADTLYSGEICKGGHAAKISPVSQFQKVCDFFLFCITYDFHFKSLILIKFQFIYHPEIIGMLYCKELIHISFVHS